jgi:hypothetical protein
MKTPAAQFPYVPVDASEGGLNLLPFMPLTLRTTGQSITASGLVDTGATINLLPYNVGLALGASWEQDSAPIQLTGLLTGVEARALVTL